VGRNAIITPSVKRIGNGTVICAGTKETKGAADSFFLIQSVPTYSPTKIVKMVKSITAKEIFKRALQAKKQLWGGEFWKKGYFISTVGRHGSEDIIGQYVKNQGTEKKYKKLHSQQVQLELF
jgi:putative transposase